MGYVTRIRERVFGVSETSSRATKYGSLLVMNAELVSMFITGMLLSHFLLVWAGFFTGLLSRGRVRSALWHGAVAGVVGGYVISLIFAGQYGVFGYRVTPQFLLSLPGNINWLYDLTPFVAFFGIIAFVTVDVMLGALGAGLLNEAIGLAKSAPQDGAASAED